MLRQSLEKDGFEVLDFENGKTAFLSLRQKKPDLIVLDWDMPIMSGIEFIERIRREGSQVPVIFLTIKDTEEYRIEGLEKGADDYISKPFSIKELVTRIKVVLRRYNKTESVGAEKVLNDGSITLNLNSYMGSFDGKDMQLTVTEFRLMEAFISNPDMVFSREKLMDISFPEDSYSSDRSIDSHIKRLRKKIGMTKIETVYGLGYKYKKD